MVCSVRHALSFAARVADQRHAAAAAQLREDDNLQLYVDLEPDIYVDGCLSLAKTHVRIARTIYLCDGSLLAC